MVKKALSRTVFSCSRGSLSCRNSPGSETAARAAICHCELARIARSVGSARRWEDGRQEFSTIDARRYAQRSRWPQPNLGTAAEAIWRTSCQITLWLTAAQRSPSRQTYFSPRATEAKPARTAEQPSEWFTYPVCIGRLSRWPSVALPSSVALGEKSSPAANAMAGRGRLRPLAIRAVARDMQPRKKCQRTGADEIDSQIRRDAIPTVGSKNQTTFRPG